MSEKKALGEGISSPSTLPSHSLSALPLLASLVGISRYVQVRGQVLLRAPYCFVGTRRVQRESPPACQRLRCTFPSNQQSHWMGSNCGTISDMSTYTG